MPMDKQEDISILIVLSWYGNKWYLFKDLSRFNWCILDLMLILKKFP